MSALVIEPPATSGPASSRRSPPARPRRTAGRPPAAVIRSASHRVAPPAHRGRPSAAAPAKRPRLPDRPAAPTTTWQLTDRGVAVIVVAMLMIMAAAAMVVGLTALRVTGDSYVGAGQSQFSTR